MEEYFMKEMIFKVGCFLKLFSLYINREFLKILNDRYLAFFSDIVFV